MENTTEKNRLIAEFMGWKKVWDMPNIDKAQKYHESWDWLMPVVGVISSQCEEPEELDDLRMALLCADIDTAYSEVIRCIKGYNSGEMLKTETANELH